MQTKKSESLNGDLNTEFAARVEASQRELAGALRQSHDFIVCGAGSSGSVVARRLAENPAVNVLLLEAGGTDELPEIHDAARWRENLGSAHDWAFKTRPNPHLNGRSLMWSMGKVLGGGSSINAMIWSRGHKNDWDHFAAESGDDGWSYSNVLDIYRRIEDWQGASDPKRRGTGGLVVVEQSPVSPIVRALCEGAQSVGIPQFADQNGVMMETEGGAAPANVRIRGGRRLSVFRSYAYPYMDRPNLTVLTHALVTRITFEGKRATGVECIYNGKPNRISAGNEVVLSLGAIHTPKVLMQSGIGDEVELQRFGIPLVQHLPGVGQNFQDHAAIGCIWEYQKPLALHNSGGEATFFWKSDPNLDTPDIQTCLAEVPLTSTEMLTRLKPPAGSWTMFGGIVRPKSRGRIRLTGLTPRTLSRSSPT